MFSALGVHGACVVTCVTAQNPNEMRAIQPCRPALVHQQLQAVFAVLPPAAAKTGMLYSKAIVSAVAEFFCGPQRPPLVIDPVMAATSGHPVLEQRALRALREELLPRATLVTPNLAEAEVLAGLQVRDPEEMRQAARQLHRRYGCAALVKGGHLRPGKEALDIYYDGRTELVLTAPYVHGLRTHGTGCTYSAAIVAWLALGYDLPGAVRQAKASVTLAIARSVRVRGHDVLWARFRQRKC
jgi:hydroxymethylpyrimidine/phosphomethylpyrimidine kinase